MEKRYRIDLVRAGIAAVDANGRLAQCFVGPARVGRSLGWGRQSAGKSANEGNDGSGVEELHCGESDGE